MRPVSFLPGFGKKKEKDPKAAKRKKDEEEQKKKELEEAKKKKEELERKKVERAEQEETARMAAKRERYQQLLQKNPDPTRRVFQFHMKAIKVEYLAQDPTAGLFLKTTLGGDYSEREEPGKGLVRKGKKGQQFQTSKAGKLSELETHYYRNEVRRDMDRTERIQAAGQLACRACRACRAAATASSPSAHRLLASPPPLSPPLSPLSLCLLPHRPSPRPRSALPLCLSRQFGAGIPVYWMGSYIDLEIQEFQLELMQSFSLKKNKRRAVHAITLAQLAQGSVMLDFTLQVCGRLPPSHSSHPTSLLLTPSHFFSPHLTPSHSFSPRLTPPHPTSPHLTPPHLTSPHLTQPCPSRTKRRRARRPAPHS